MMNSLSSFIFIVVALHCSLFWSTGVNGEGQCYDKPGVVPEAESSEWTCPYVAYHLDLCENKFVAMHCPTTCESYCRTCNDSNKRLCMFIQSLSPERLREYCETSYQANTGCPETCDSCLDGCQDNPDGFIFNIFMDTHKTSCEEGKPEWCKDEKGVFAQNCKITCGLCIVVPPAPPVVGARSVFIGSQGLTTFVTYDNGDDPKGAGRNDSGQLGIGSLTNGQASPIDISLQPNVNIIDGGFVHTCALEDGGNMFCMGSNGYGQLGIGSSGGTYPSVQQVTSLSDVTAIASGFTHTCAIAQSVLWCWGSNGYGQNGNGLSSDSNISPVQVDVSAFPGVTPVSVSCGQFFTCALFSDNKVRCWGKNTYGNIGADPGNHSTLPVEVDFPVGSATPRDVSCGIRHTCALMSDNTISCWGSNSAGKLGTGTIGGNFHIPQSTAVINNAVSIYTGGSHSCALLSDKNLYCWGVGQSGQLGLGDNTNLVATPTLVPLSSDVKDAATGLKYTCAVLVNGSVWCWGDNYEGQLGLGYTTPEEVYNPAETLF